MLFYVIKYYAFCDNLIGIETFTLSMVTDESHDVVTE